MRIGCLTRRIYSAGEGILTGITTKMQPVLFLVPYLKQTGTNQILLVTGTVQNQGKTIFVAVNPGR